MKKIVARIGLSTLAAGLLFSANVYADEVYDEVAQEVVSTETGFWKKKDKDAEPKIDEPAPQESHKSTPAPQETPQESPAPKKDSGAQHDDGASFVRYYRNPSPDQGAEYQRNDMGNPGGTIMPNNANPGTQNQQNQQYQPNQQQQQQQNQHNQQNQPHQQGQTHSTDYAPGIAQEIHKILANQPAISLDPNAYIVQHEDGLWLVMGNIRAKLEILIYVDQKNMNEAEYDGGKAIPLYK